VGPWNAIGTAPGDRLPQARRVLRALSPEAERAIADALLAAIHEAGNPARVAFENPDAIVLIETIGGRAGMALLTRDDYRQHPLLASH
jgi:hypothetical protein